MRFSEFKPLKPFKAQVRLKTDKSIVLILTWADNQTSARRNLAHLYGSGNVLSLSQIPISEAKEISPQDQQITALKQQAKQLKQQAKLARARNQVTQAQDQLRKAKLPTQAQAQP
jgi:hypothetical protein